MKVKDGIVGFVVADALGVPVEFSQRDELLKKPVTDMIGYGTYNMPPGTFSDDSSMTLATMASIVNNNGEIVYEDIMNEFIEWWQNSKYTQYDNTFDIGNTTSVALYNYMKGANVFDCGLLGDRDNGNGSLMRILPLAFIKDIDYKTIENVSGLTHGHPRSKLACVFYVEFAKSILNDNDKSIKEHVSIASDKIKDYYKDSNEIKKFKRILDGSIFDDDIDTIKSSGYVLSTLEAVIYILGNTNSYKEAVLGAVNLGSDTDTVGAISGGIAGLFYGYDDIPVKWINKIKGIDKVIDLCKNYGKVLK
ncbi:MAG: ADP-ribosylglycohydrolase family protein [Methanobrevibacter sp.]|nr:ADP-ribosylglycohydrolase family protein [Methanobrevibacter sp.]